jgi:hypothetical protein
VAGLRRLAELLRAEGGILAQLALPLDGEAPAAGPGAVAASGPRAAGREGEYELFVETIYEGFLLHYATPRLLRRTTTPALKVLAGDRLYALGLARLVALGDIAAVQEMADVLTIGASAYAVGNGELAEAVWWAGARAIGWGPTADHRRAKTLALAGDPEALAAFHKCLQ